MTVLSEHLSHIAAQPGRRQSHALASLRVLERARRRLAAQEKAGVALSDTPFGKVLAAASAVTKQSVEKVVVGEPPMLQRPTLRRHRSPVLPELPACDDCDSGDLSPTSASTLASFREVEPSTAYQRRSIKLVQRLARIKRAAAFAAAEAKAPKTMQLRCGVHQIPHPRKAMTGGEDSFFMAGSGMGVADGVGEWEWRFKINPRAFADELMFGAKAVVEAPPWEARAAGSVTAAASAKEQALRALESGYNGSASWGSATCCVAALSTSERELGVANLGDSGARIVRFGPEGVPQVIERTVEQQHCFNCPFQLSRLPPKEEWEDVRARGYGELIDAISGTSGAQDLPHKAALYSFQVQEGDLVILGSDGLWDNLFEYELLELLEDAAQKAARWDLDSSCSEDDDLLRKLGFTARRSTRRRALTIDPAMLAKTIADKTFSRSAAMTGRTPFADSAEKFGLHHRGGKMDDITVVVGWVLQRGRCIPDRT